MTDIASRKAGIIVGFALGASAAAAGRARLFQYGDSPAGCAGYCVALLGACLMGWALGTLIASLDD
jgi:hypothetical protein